MGPAFTRSVRTDGDDVTFRPRTTSASISNCGPWQIAATGLPLRRTHGRRAPRPRRCAVIGRIAARNQQRVELVDVDVGSSVLDGRARLALLTGHDLAGFGADTSIWWRLLHRSAGRWTPNPRGPRRGRLQFVIGASWPNVEQRRAPVTAAPRRPMRPTREGRRRIYRPPYKPKRLSRGEAPIDCPSSRSAQPFDSTLLR